MLARLSLILLLVCSWKYAVRNLLLWAIRRQSFSSYMWPGQYCASYMVSTTFFGFLFFVCAGACRGCLCHLRPLISFRKAVPSPSVGACYVLCICLISVRVIFFCDCY